MSGQFLAYRFDKFSLICYQEICGNQISENLNLTQKHFFVLHWIHLVMI